MILSTHGIIGSSGSGSPFLTSLYAVYKAESNANDSLGTYNGTPVGGLTYSAGKSGNAFTFNGTNAHVLMPVNSLKKTTFSMNFWLFNPAAQSSTLFSDFANDGLNKGLYIDLNNISSHTIRFVGFNSSVNTIALSATGGIGFINRWSMTTITVNGTSLKIYLDGTLTASGTMTLPLNYATNSYPCIGAYKLNNNTPSAYLSNGTKVDEFYIWNKELTATEITELYNAGTGKFYPTF
jgi:hypothetical protein